MSTEADTCRKFVVPKLQAAGWDSDPHSIAEQRSFTDGRIVVRGNKAERKKNKRADYLLRYTRDFPIAVTEAKAEYKKGADGLQQAKDYVGILGLKFAYATNGKEIIEFDFITGIGRLAPRHPRPRLQRRIMKWLFNKIGFPLVSLAIMTLSFALSAQEPRSTPDPMEQSKRIDAELKKLDQTPVGQEIATMEKKFEDGMFQVTKAREEIRNGFMKLEETERYRDYEKKRRELENQREDKWTIERKAMAEAATKIYGARHEELKKLAPSDTPQARQLVLDVLTYPRVDGSTSTHPLSVIIACRVLGMPYQWVYPEPTGSPYRPRFNLQNDLFLFDEWEYFPSADKMEFSLAASRVVAQPPHAGQERVAIMINSLLAINTSTHDAYTNLIEGKCDLNLTARAPSEDELALARNKGVKIELRPIARDGLVFIVNYKNPVKTISREQVRQIYQGKIKSWIEFAGVTNEIDALWRDRNSGSRELFDMLVPAGQPIPEPKFRRELFSTSMAGPFNQVTEDLNAIGYSVYYYEHYMALSPYTRMVAIDGIEPTAATIASGKYPFTANVYAAYRAGEPAGSPTMKLLDWLVSPEGQAVVRESGYVPTN